ncbi:kelch repeat-containing protein [Paenibacillus alba]|uniref:Kelch repeat-containing protein n=1 Tax=Paenibacillus alba TaxID=1197127 RepID=A0ABU6GEN5_9BACL|nr:kelch repeat-containing protein [Paenibacillus alba]MEC0232686.1 kelch repeat-containing protein [Paenibacillus alba]
MPFVRGAAANVAYNNKIYLFGGFGNSNISVSTVNMYDPATDTWSSKTDMPLVNTAAAAVVLTNKIYLVGGKSNQNNAIYTILQQYDPTSDTWSTQSYMPTARSSLSAEVHLGKIYAIGGANSTGAVNTVEVYDPETNTWSTKASLINARYLHGSASVNGNFYVIGGSTTTLAANGSVEKYTIADSPINENERAILTVTLNTGLEKEFDLSMSEVNAFINWYEAKQGGTGTASYAIDKHNNNIGPFKSRKDYCYC